MYLFKKCTMTTQFQLHVNEVAGLTLYVLHFVVHRYTNSKAEFCYIQYV